MRRIRCGGDPVTPGGMPAGMGPPDRNLIGATASTAYQVHRDTRRGHPFGCPLLVFGGYRIGKRTVTQMQRRALAFDRGIVLQWTHLTRKRGKSMAQHYMTYEERIRLETLLGEKRSVAYIAGKLGFSRQTIYNEIKRGSPARASPWRGAPV